MADNVENRSSAMDPHTLALVNTTVTNAVQEALKGVFANLMPVLKEMAITPEKLREANAPQETPEQKVKRLRDLRESMKSKEDEAELHRVNRARMDACPHLDKNGRSSINRVHNYPDHQPRGVCVVCGDWIHPREWRIGPADEKNTRGRAYLVEAHKDYRVVMQLENLS